LTTVALSILEPTVVVGSCVRRGIQMKNLSFAKHAKRLLEMAQECGDPKLRERLVAMAEDWIEDATENRAQPEQAATRRH
jgi:hypothetical protein